MTNSKEIDRFALAAKPESIERYLIAVKLEDLLSYDLLSDELDAVKQAIEIIYPGFAEKRKSEEQMFNEWFDKQSPEQQETFAAELRDAITPDFPDGNMIPFREK